MQDLVHCFYLFIYLSFSLLCLYKHFLVLPVDYSEIFYCVVDCLHVCKQLVWGAIPKVCTDEESYGAIFNVTFLVHFQVIRFASEADRREFLFQLAVLLKANNIPLQKHEMSTKDILGKAMTKTKRQQLLNKFFRNVFTEVHVTTSKQFTVPNNESHCS